MEIKVGTLSFRDLKINSGELHKFRGYIGNLYKKYDLIHNHREDGSSITRYPLIQFKLIDKTPSIIAITEKAIEVFSKIFLSMDEVIIDNFKIPVHEKELKVETCEAGFTDETMVYEIISPWVALNKDNYTKYRQTKTYDEQTMLLEKILIGNIMSMSKGLGIHLNDDERIKISLKHKHVRAKLKGIPMSAFTGIFKTNYIIPDYFGIGKSVSRGYGTIKKIL